MQPKDQSVTATRIKDAARTIFHAKGYAGTTVRDIATEAGENAALVNYYFRSKENLFNEVMRETFASFVQGLLPVVHDSQTSLGQKMEVIVRHYTEMLIEEPDLARFVISELQRDARGFFAQLELPIQPSETILFKQLKEAAPEPKVMHASQFLLNLLGMTVFPFVARPMIEAVSGVTSDQFEQLVNQRMELIPKWVTTQINEINTHEEP